MPIKKVKLFYNKYISLPLYYKLIINFILILFTHYSLTVLLRFSLYNYTSTYSTYFPRNEEFDISVLYPTFYYAVLVLLVINILIFITGFLLGSTKSNINSNQNITKYFTLKIYKKYIYFTKPYREGNLNKEIIKDKKCMFFVIICIIILTTISLLVLIIGYRLVFVTTILITCAIAGYLLAKNYGAYNKKYILLIIPYIFIVSSLTAISTQKIHGYLKKTGRGGDIKIKIILKDKRSLDGYHILTSKNITTLLTIDRKSVISINNSDIDRKIIDKINIYERGFNINIFNKKDIW